MRLHRSRANAECGGHLRVGQFLEVVQHHACPLPVRECAHRGDQPAATLRCASRRCRPTPASRARGGEPDGPPRAVDGDRGRGSRRCRGRYAPSAPGASPRPAAPCSRTNASCTTSSAAPASPMSRYADPHQWRVLHTEQCFEAFPRRRRSHGKLHTSSTRSSRGRLTEFPEPLAPAYRYE